MRGCRTGRARRAPALVVDDPEPAAVDQIDAVGKPTPTNRPRPLQPIELLDAVEPELQQPQSQHPEDRDPSSAPNVASSRHGAAHVGLNPGAVARARGLVCGKHVHGVCMRCGLPIARKYFLARNVRPCSTDSDVDRSSRFPSLDPPHEPARILSFHVSTLPPVS